MKNRTLAAISKGKTESLTGRIIVVTGARQTGKTTLVRRVFPDYEYLSIEDPVMRLQYASLTAAQWHNTYPLAILDDVQKMPQLIESIKSVYDQFPDAAYVLTGSSQLLLLNKVKESLAGRCSIFELYPFTLPEMLTDGWEDKVKPSNFQKLLMDPDAVRQLPHSFMADRGYAEKQEVLEHYLKFGAYPAISAKNIPARERYDWLRNYIRTYLERDVRDLSDFRNLEPFIKIQQMSSMNTGKVLNYSKLAGEAGVSVKTAQRFIEYLVISYQAILLRPWARNLQKRLVRSPKLHYIDPGIQFTILQKIGGMTGLEFESAIIGEIYKQIKTNSIPAQLYHLRTFDGREVDLLIETEGGYFAFEVIMSTHVTRSDARQILDIGQILDKPVILSLIISLDPMVRDFGSNTYAVPSGLFLL